MHLYIFINILFSIVNCEWVEITPIKNIKYFYGIKNVDQTTTTSNYENIIKNPSITKLDITTTTEENFIEENLMNVTDSGTLEEKVITQISNPSQTSTEIFNSADYDEDYEENKNIPTPSEGFLSFLQTIQKNLLKFKNKSHRGKMAVLKHLRDHLLINIKGHIMNIWKPKISSEARGYDEDEHHMDFPSNEGALMTIGFLTFAVFLIKLVIKLIHALKAKQQYYGTTTTTTAASVVFLKRKKRDEEHAEIAKILQYIEEF